MSTTTRTRWAAVGAAVAVTLGAGGMGLVDATSGGEADQGIFEPVGPCRLLDTRPDQGIGGRTTPLAPGETQRFTASGDQGECAGIPADAVAVELNVTGLLTTGATHFTLWDGRGDVPNASHVNIRLGDGPTPNSVTTALDDGGFALFNSSANAHVIVDLVGVYREHDHDDRYYTQEQIGDRFFAVEGERNSSLVQVATEANSVAINSVAVDVPGPGQVLLSVDGWFQNEIVDGTILEVLCSLSIDGNYDASHETRFLRDDLEWSTDFSAPFSLQRVIDVSGATTIEGQLVCFSPYVDTIVVSRLVATYLP